MSGLIVGVSRLLVAVADKVEGAKIIAELRDLLGEAPAASSARAPTAKPGDDR